MFVGYADSLHAKGDFPNPWEGSPTVTFDGCTPAAACIFDGGAIRVQNDGSSSVMVNQLNVHIGPCLFTWTGPMYPVTLTPGASLVTTQRASGAAGGCTGPDPSTFDSSDIPSSGICTNDGLQATVDVTVDGTVSSFADTGQVLNTGGIDPAICSGANESTEWVRIGSTPCPGQNLSLAPAAQTLSVGTTATVSATFTNKCGSPLSGVVVKFNVVAGSDAGTNGSGVTDAAGNANFSYSSLLVGIDTLQAAVTNSVGFTTTSNTVSVTWIVEFAPGGGSFVIGNRNAAIGNEVNIWGAQWAKHNSLSGGPAPRSFKGFAEEPTTPRCGEGWTADPGNSTPPPDGPLPALMAVIVTSAAHQSGSETSGDIVEIVVVKTNPGYEPNPGHSATGTVVSVVCGGSPHAATASSTLAKSRSGDVASASTTLQSTTAAASDGCRTKSHGNPSNRRPECSAGLRKRRH